MRNSKMAWPSFRLAARQPFQSLSRNSAPLQPVSLVESTFHNFYQFLFRHGRLTIFLDARHGSGGKGGQPAGSCHTRKRNKSSFRHRQSQKPGPATHTTPRGDGTTATPSPLPWAKGQPHRGSFFGVLVGNGPCQRNWRFAFYHGA